LFFAANSPPLGPRKAPRAQPPQDPAKRAELQDEIAKAEEAKAKADRHVVFLSHDAFETGLPPSARTSQTVAVAVNVASLDLQLLQVRGGDFREPLFQLKSFVIRRERNVVRWSS
jgi:hypothetical protein